ncbi:MAG: hypothetical protein ABIR98_13965 [Usitatibacter sp.]
MHKRREMREVLADKLQARMKTDEIFGNEMGIEFPATPRLQAKRIADE